MVIYYPEHMQRQVIKNTVARYEAIFGQQNRYTRKNALSPPLAIT